MIDTLYYVLDIHVGAHLNGSVASTTDLLDSCMFGIDVGAHHLNGFIASITALCYIVPWEVTEF